MEYAIMKGNFRRSMIWLHTYSGLVLGWLLFTIFLTGSLSYFNPEISQWMKPELVKVSNSQNLIKRSLDELHQRGQGASTWRIYLPDERNEHWYIQWGTGRRDRSTISLADANSQLKQKHTQNQNHIQNKTINARETASGNFFRIFHYTLQLRDYGGRYFSGIAAMFMLVAVFTGIFTHRRFFRDFFTLRLSNLTKTLSDFHALAGILTIPFCIMICTSGIMIYTIMYMPFSANHYAGGERALSRSLSPGLASIDTQSKTAMPLKDFSIVEKQIKQHWPGDNQIRRITFEQAFSSSGRIIVDRVKHHTVFRGAERLVFSANTGALISGYPKASTAARVRSVFFGLHEAHFANISLRFLLFLLGLLATSLIATGLIIWLRQRLQKLKKIHVGHKLVSSLNLAVIGGLPVAVIVYFWGNRVLPVAMENRADAEIKVFVFAWFLCLIHSLIQDLYRKSQKAWSEQLGLCAIACFLLPFFDLFQDYTRLLNALKQGNAVYLSFTIALILVSLVFAKVAIWLCKSTNKSEIAADQGRR